MTVRLNPYLQFDSSARAALEFYHSVLGGDLQIMTFGDMGATGPVPPPEGVMHGMLTTADGFVLMASDGDPQHPAGSAGNVSVSISGDEIDKVRGWFVALSEGGSMAVPFEKQMWGDHYGQFTDRFGINWLMNAGDPG